MRTQTITVNVIEFELLRNTANGGKRYRVTWEGGVANTQPDAAVAYMINERPGRYEIDLNARGLITGMRGFGA